MEVIEKNDWRLRGQENYLKGRRLIKMPYFRWSETWDHEHCEFCWDKFSDYEGDLHEGNVTVDDKYNWICPECFADFKEMFQWEPADAEETK